MSVNMGHHQVKTQMIFGFSIERIMKKHCIAILALSLSVVFVSCEKEVNLNSADNNSSATLIGVPDCIHATIADEETRTSYDADGKFTWNTNDGVRLIVVAAGNMSTGSPQGYSTYYATDLTDGNKTATFKNGENSLMGFTTGTYESTGIAVYPTRIARPSAGGVETHGYGKPFITIPEQGKDDVRGLASEIIMTGVEMDDHSNFKFSTAMAVLKITVKNIPSEATCLKLSTNNKASYPIDGDFVLEKNGDGLVVFTPAQHQIYAGDPTGNGYLRVDLSGEAAIASRDFYFNVPIANYPAGTLSLTIEDELGNPTILSKTINKALNLSRNDCLVLPALIANTVTVDRNAVTPYLKFANETGEYLRVHITTTELTSSNYNSADWKEGNKFTTQSGSFDLTNLSDKNGNKYLNITGSYYLNYMVLNGGSVPATLSESNVIRYGSIPFYYLDKGTNKIDLASCTVTPSSTEASEGAVEYLWDGSTNNYWHSKWSSGTHVYSPEYGVYIDIALAAPLTKFQVLYNIRYNNNNGRPREIVYAYSNDGSVYNRIPGAYATSDMDGAAGAWVNMPYVDAGTSFNYLRIGITKAGDGPSWLTGGGGSTAIGELELYGE